MPFSRSQNSKTAKKSAFIRSTFSLSSGNKKVGRTWLSDWRAETNSAKQFLRLYYTPRRAFVNVKNATRKNRRASHFLSATFPWSGKLGRRKAAEGRRTPKRWREFRRLPKSAKRLGVRRSSGALPCGAGISPPCQKLRCALKTAK
jgi:hypothetical protein